MIRFDLKMFASDRLNRISQIVEHNILKDGVWLAGGALQVLFEPEIEINDFDLFFKNEHEAARVREMMPGFGYKEVFACPKGELYTYKHKDFDDFVKVQLITKFYYNSMEELIESFDFTVAMFVTDGSQILTNPAAISDLQERELKINKITYPIATLNRMFKYVNKKGFSHTADAVIDFVKMVNEGTFTDDEMALYID